MHRSSNVLLCAALLFLIACNDRGCSRLEPLTDFPPAKRVPNATQLRVSQTGIAAIAASPEIVVEQLFGGTEMNVAPSCGGSPAVCCPGGVPQQSCGPIVLDVVAQAGDAARLTISPAQNTSRLDVTLRARVSTVDPIPVNVSLAGDCTLAIDSTAGADDIALHFTINFVQDPTTSTTRMVVGNMIVDSIAAEDMTLGGGFGCQLASLGLGFLIDTLTDALTQQLQDHLNDRVCQACPSGEVAECGLFATACVDQTCVINGRCKQELGIMGILTSAGIFGGAPPGSTGRLDLHELAGGYATTNNGGVALGVLGGVQPRGELRDRCGPAATEPSSPTIPLSTYFQGNVTPDTNTPFDVALGVHASTFDQLAYALYDGGALCATIGTEQLPELSSADFATSIPSLAMLPGGNVPIAIGLRPQAPPTVALGNNTFHNDGSVDAPLFDLAFEGMELDLIASIERQPVVVLTAVADVQVPLGMRIDETGALQPVLGAVTTGEISIKASAALQESAAQLTGVVPDLVSAALPALIERIGSFALPPLAGMNVDATSLTTVEQGSFVALLAELNAPDTSSAAGPTQESKQTSATPPALKTRSPFALQVSVLCALAAVLYAGRRRVPRWALGAAAASLVTLLPVACGDGAGPSQSADAGGQGGEGGAGGQGADGGTSGQGGVGAQGGAGGVGAQGGVGGDGAQGGTGGVSGQGGSPCGGAVCEAGDVVHGALGQWNAVARDASRTVITSYDALLGDLVLVTLEEGAETRRVIDGVPDLQPTHEPSSYRGGVAQAGPDVGAWSSVRIADGRVVVAYQDRDRAALRVAFEDEAGNFHAHDVDDSNDASVEIGAYASLALGSTPSIAYVATGVDVGGTRRTELRLATASAAPDDASDWSIAVIAYAEDEPTRLRDFPNGPGLFVDLLVLSDGRRVLIHYDRPQRALVAHVESAAASGTFNAITLDGGGALDRGRWLSAVVDASGLVHVAYEDAIGHQVFYLSFTPGGAVAAPEVVDDGVREGDRPHWVGAGLVLWLDAGTPHVAYQDATTANVVVATKGAGAFFFTHADMAVGAALDGFHLAAPAQGAGPLVWDRIDPAHNDVHQLVIDTSP